MLGRLPTVEPSSPAIRPWEELDSEGNWIRSLWDSNPSLLRAPTPPSPGWGSWGDFASGMGSSQPDGSNLMDWLGDFGKSIRGNLSGAAAGQQAAKPKAAAGQQATMFPPRLPTFQDRAMSRMGPLVANQLGGFLGFPGQLQGAMGQLGALNQANANRAMLSRQDENQFNLTKAKMANDLAIVQAQLQAAQQMAQFQAAPERTRMIAEYGMDPYGVVGQGQAAPPAAAQTTERGRMTLASALSPQAGTPQFSSYGGGLRGQELGQQQQQAEMADALARWQTEQATGLKGKELEYNKEANDLDRALRDYQAKAQVGLSEKTLANTKEAKDLDRALRKWESSQTFGLEERGMGLKEKEFARKMNMQDMLMQALSAPVPALTGMAGMPGGMGGGGGGGYGGPSLAQSPVWGPQQYAAMRGAPAGMTTQGDDLARALGAETRLQADLAGTAAAAQQSLGVAKGKAKGKAGRRSLGAKTLQDLLADEYQRRQLLTRVAWT